MAGLLFDHAVDHEVALKLLNSARSLRDDENQDQCREKPHSGLYRAMRGGMVAFTAKEHGLVGSGQPVSTATYNAAIAPIRSVIALPSGY